MLKVSVLQSDLLWSSPQENLNNFSRMIDENSDSSTDLYILPEMFTSGFITKPQEISSVVSFNADKGLKWMQDIAIKHKCAITGSLAIQQDGKYYNRMYFVTADQVFSYDKSHLFSYGAEDLYYTSGNKKVVVEYKGWKILLAICYDLRFPVWCRNNHLDSYDLMIYVASWPDTRIFVWDILLRARAIENQAYVIGCNRIGKDPYNSHCGHSQIIDYKGQLVSTPSQDCVTLSASLELKGLKNFREKFPALKDADPITL